MTVYRIAPLAVLVALAVALPAQAQVSQLKIAVANTARIFTDMQETKDLKLSLEAEGKRFEGDAAERNEKLKTLKEACDQLKTDSPQYHDKLREYEEERIKFEVWGKMMQADAQHERVIQIKDLFEKIQNAVNEVAANNGIDLVLNDNRPEIPEDLDKVSMDQLRSLILSRTVLFAGPKADLTNDVLALLNARYAAGKPTTAH